MKEQRQKFIDTVLQEIESVKKNNTERDDKLDDIIREISNVDFKHGVETELINSEITKIKQPIKDQMTNMQKENEVLLRELGRTQKDYRLMLSEFYTAINRDPIDPSIKSQVLNKTGEIMCSHDSFSMSNKRE